MTQNHEQPVNPRRRFMAAATLTTCALNLCGGVISVAKTEPTCTDIDTSERIVASATYDINDGQVNTASTAIPDAYRDAYQTYIPNTLDDPIVQLASRNGDVASLTIGVSDAERGPLRSGVRNESAIYYDEYCGVENQIALSFDPELTSTPEIGLFANEYNTRLIVVHEAIHGINSEWWQNMKDTRAFDRVQDPKIYELQNACDGINKWLSYQNTGKMPKTLSYPDSVSIADVCSTQAMTMNTKPLREIFRCVNEGDMIKSRRKLKDSANLGHPWDNVTELASSITNILHFNPSYIRQCLTKQDRMDAALITNYVKAALRISFSHEPQLERILRQDANTAEALDFLLATH